jgi:methionyl-tRNA formyltransferase
MFHRLRQRTAYHYVGEENRQGTEFVKVALFCNDDLTSNLLFAPLFDVAGIEVTGVYVASAPRRGHSSNFSGALALLRRMALRYWIFLVVTNGLFKLFERTTVVFGLSAQNGWLKSLRARACDFSVPFRRVSNFNAPEFVAEIAAQNVDLIIIRVGAILRTAILDLPERGTWCVHSSILPSFKGIAGEFQALRKRDAPIGSTVFEVTPVLDEGPPLAQTKIARDQFASVFSHMLRNNLAASELLVAMLEKETEGSRFEGILFNSGLPSSYHTWPSSDEVKAFRASGGRLIRFREVIPLLLGALRIVRPSLRLLP